MTMVVRLSSGGDARVKAPFMMFKNGYRRYRIRVVPDKIDGGSYKTGRKGCIYYLVMQMWLQDC